MTQTAQKQADIRYRVQLKDKPWIVVYKVVSSDGERVYDVTVVRGHVNNCTCISRKPCYHWKGVQAREDVYNRNHDAERTAYNNYCLAMGI
jgi:hypothetical protein